MSQVNNTVGKDPSNRLAQSRTSFNSTNGVQQSIINPTDPLQGLENVSDFIKKLDVNFESHMRCLEKFHNLLDQKAKLDQAYSKELHMISSQFSDLSRHAVNDRIKDLVLALGRNFKNFANNIEIMSYDLLTEGNRGFDQCKDDTQKELTNIKLFLKGL